MKTFITLLMITLSLTAVGKNLTCKNLENPEMILEMSSTEWTNDSNSGVVQVRLSYQGFEVTSDDNCRLPDTPFIVACLSTIYPDNDEPQMTMIKMSDDFKEATIDLYDREWDGPMSFGTYSCDEN